MYPRSARFDAAIVNSHVQRTVAEVLNGHGNVVMTLTPTEGELSIDDVDSRRQASLTVIDETGDLVPDTAFDILNQIDTRIRIRQGIVYPDGTQELIVLGTFMIYDNIMTDAGPNVTIALTLRDQAQLIAQNVLQNDLSFDGYSHYDIAMYLLQTAGTWFEFDVRGISTTTTTTAHFQAGDDPWHKASQMLGAVGMECFFDPDGVIVVRTVPDYNSLPPAWTFKEGVDCTVYSAQKRVNRIETFNKVIVLSSGPNGDAAVRGEATDFDLSYPVALTESVRAMVISESSLTSVEQAQALAWATLRKQTGFAEFVNIQATSHPCFEIGDVIAVQRAASKINAKYIIDRVSIPLVPVRSMNISSRRRRVQV